MLTATAFRWFVAEIDYLQAHAFMDSWRKEGKPYSSKEWGIVQGALVSAIKLKPDQPEYLDAMGDLLWLKLLDDESLNSDQELTLETKGLEYYRQAILLRPTWPYTWAKYAFFKNSLYQFDDDMFLALDRSMALSPWEPVVQRNAAEIGMSVWDVLSSDQQTHIVENIDRAMERQAAEIIKLAKDLTESADGKKTLASLCSRVKPRSEWHEVCPSRP